jgi:hypothetical protein
MYPDGMTSLYILNLFQNRFSEHADVNQLDKAYEVDGMKVPLHQQQLAPLNLAFITKSIRQLGEHRAQSFLAASLLKAPM